MHQERSCSAQASARYGLGAPVSASRRLRLLLLCPRKGCQVGKRYDSPADMTLVARTTMAAQRPWGSSRGLPNLRRRRTASWHNLEVSPITSCTTACKCVSATCEFDVLFVTRFCFTASRILASNALTSAVCTIINGSQIRSRSRASREQATLMYHQRYWCPIPRC